MSETHKERQARALFKDRLEPDLTAMPQEIILASAAVSLKRIAESLEFIVHADGRWQEMSHFCNMMHGFISKLPDESLASNFKQAIDSWEQEDYPPPPIVVG